MELKLKLKKIKEDRRRILYMIDQDEIVINNKIFKCKKNTCNLSAYLNSIGYSLLELLNNSIENNCIHCDEIVNNRFERNIFITYKFCDKCDKRSIIRIYDDVMCSVCGKTIKRKDIVYSTCGNLNCLNEQRLNNNNIIKNTHWSKSSEKDKIINKKVQSRLQNDKILNRKYVPWNKGKTGIYSKETIEKIRTATINQMKNGKIKKTKIEKILEKYFIDNNIKYTYSFIFKNRQYDFLLNDYNIVIEVRGDYWHANPKFWDIDNNDNSKKKLYESQKMKIKDDIIKKNIIDNSIYNFIAIWEYDIHNNYIDVIDIINNEIKNK
jgi:G:T-mismatch repair DNA endonuclease (very short patch repair protein)